MTFCFIGFVHLTDEWKAVFAVINTAIALEAFTGNLLAFMIILNRKSFQDPSICFLGSLIMTDILVGFLLAPMHVVELVSESLIGNCMLNKARESIAIFLVGASLNSMALINFDRYLHMTKTQTYGQFMSRSKVAALIITGWAIPTVTGMFDMLGSNIRKYTQIVVSVYLYLCFVTMVLFYTYIIKLVRKKEKGMSDNQANQQIQQRRISNEIRVAKVAAAIIFRFFITVIPSATYQHIYAIKSFLHNDIASFQEMSIRSYFYTAT